MLKHLLLCLGLVCSFSLFGQQQNPWEFGLSLGTSSIGGDMIENDIVFLNQPQFAAGLMVRRRIGGMLALRAHLMYGGLKSDDKQSSDAAQAARGYASKNSVIEPGLVLELEPFAKKRFAADGSFKKILSPYLFGGVGYGIWKKPTVDFNGRTSAQITEDINEDSNGGLVVPAGVGLKYYLSPKVAINGEFSIRLTGDDLIDGVSKAGNPDKNDIYSFMQLGLNVGFGKKDQDKDGVADKDDLCPTEFGLASTGGCPDTDGDGIADKDDACPKVAGLANFAGCPDTDGDGVIDKEDTCPEVAGLATLMGCPDADGDGVADKDDACPQVAGVAGLMGCPDADGDGIADKDDACPEVAGIARFNGCPDTDGDGIVDAEDECPKVAGVANRNGCPEPPAPVAKYESLEDRIARYRPLVEGFNYINIDEATGTIKIANVYFATDSYRLDRKARAILNEINQFLARSGAEKFTIRHEGHADERNSQAYNQALSENRAKAVQKYVVGLGTIDSVLSLIGYGENEPLGPSLRENRVVVNVASEPARRINK